MNSVSVKIAKWARRGLVVCGGCRGPASDLLEPCDGHLTEHQPTIYDQVLSRYSPRPR
ncbi:hypothetical protein SAMN05216227_105615 [Pseudorhodobacter antarcticus]|jgi:hypothetical protein|uniref:Uncharacterized protein n=1 Tax=Pseudorhodobacter antarcticus TaxID=1077947 RepID=A0A1H8MJH4_9RHOB|nr:hypothetical protein SAMN05216227_105615 [Pseudorhodobacter antarcticus]